MRLIKVIGPFVELNPLSISRFLCKFSLNSMEQERQEWQEVQVQDFPSSMVRFSLDSASPKLETLKLFETQ